MEGGKPGDRPISGAGGPAINISVPTSAQTLLSPSPAQGCVQSTHTRWSGALAFESLWWVMGSQGDSLAQVGTDFPSPPGAYLGGWGIRESLPGRNVEPRWTGPGAQQTRLRFLRIASTPPAPTVGIRAQPWRSRTAQVPAARPELQSPARANLSPQQLGRPPPSPCPRPLAQGPIHSRAWVHLPTSLGGHPRANALTPRHWQHASMLAFGSVCTRDVYVCPAAGSRGVGMVYVF